MRKTSSKIALSLLLLLLTACGAQTEGALTQAQLEEGQALYEANCAACHGIAGEGQAPPADGSMPAPPHDSSGHTWHHPDPLLLQIIAEGGQMPGSRMPAFGDQLTDEEMELILAYIKTFWVAEHREVQADITRRFLEGQ